METGLFIALEGIDGTGTTTQARRLARWLDERGEPLVLTEEPTAERVGRIIRRILQHRLLDAATEQPLDADEKTMALLFAADRSDHLETKILPALHAGRIVVSDRHYLSSVAYQSVGADMAWVEALNASFRRPDLTLVLDVEPEVALRRKQGGQAERYERAHLLERVRDNYRRACEHAQARGERIEWLSARPPAEEVARQIREVVALLLGKREKGSTA